MGYPLPAYTAGHIKIKFHFRLFEYWAILNDQTLNDMGQSVTLYQVTKDEYLTIADNPDDANLFELAKSSRTFDQSFEGLRFVLSKNRDAETTNLVQEIFYPVCFLGEDIDYSTLDFEQVPDDFNFDQTVFNYHDLPKVKLINQFLNTVSTTDFSNAFNPDELNANDIYPNIWNTNEGEEYAFNEAHLLQEFINLKNTFSEAAQGDDYIFCAIG